MRFFPFRVANEHFSSNHHVHPPARPPLLEGASVVVANGDDDDDLFADRAARQDLGKSSNDLLSKDFPIGFSGLEVKTTTPSNVLFKVTGQSKPDSSILGAIEGKFTDRKNGLTFTQTWNQANQLATHVELDNQIVNGLKVELKATLDPPKAQETEKATNGVKGATLLTTYKMPGLHTRGALDIFKVRIYFF